jgi:hypothetical protein
MKDDSKDENFTFSKSRRPAKRRAARINTYRKTLKAISKK